MSKPAPTAAAATADAAPADAATSRGGRWFRVIGTLIVCVSVLATAAATIVVINRTEPTAKKINTVRKSAALVETLVARRGTYAPQLTVLGTVRPAEEIVLSPRVEGQVIAMSPAFVPGGMVSEGDLLLRVDPADFENALASRRSGLRQAQAALKVEEGRQTLARKELSLLEGSIRDANRSLVLREPQIESVRAEVEAAAAAVGRAELDLRRTLVSAPFDAQVLSRSVNVGSQVAPGAELARLVGTRQYWVMAAVPVRNLYRIQFPDADGVGSPVTLRNPDSWPPGEERAARVSRMMGSLDEQTRLARVLITVDDPLARETTGPPLILDSLIQVDIQCRPIEGVVRLDRRYVRDDDTVWVMREEKLEIREATIAFTDARFAYIQGGVEDGEHVVTTTLATVAEGVGLRRIEDSSERSDPLETAD